MGKVCPDSSGTASSWRGFFPECEFFTLRRLAFAKVITVPRGVCASQVKFFNFTETVGGRGNCLSQFKSAGVSSSIMYLPYVTNQQVLERQKNLTRIGLPRKSIQRPHGNERSTDNIVIGHKAASGATHVKPGITRV